jgi:hypothetical protein
MPFSTISFNEPKASSDEYPDVILASAKAEGR